MSCTFSFVDVVMFFCDGPYDAVMVPQQPCYTAVHGLIPLLHGCDLY